MTRSAEFSMTRHLTNTIFNATTLLQLLQQQQLLLLLLLLLLALLNSYNVAGSNPPVGLRPRGDKMKTGTWKVK
jgi:hypothetical protein